MTDARHPDEVQLAGGTSNRGLVVRMGDTVRRPMSPASQGAHALLRHLEDTGFDGAPKFLGQDEKGREVLTYIRGDVPIAPVPPWARSDAALISVAQLVRRFHQAVQGFDPTPYTWPTRVPPAFRDGLVCHNDLNLDNVVFSDGEAVALIDFDLASPGSRLWDVAMLARLWVPLRDPRDIDDERAGRTQERLLLIADAYGLSRAERRRLVTASRQTHDWCYDIVRSGAQRGQRGYVEYWTPGAQVRAIRGQRWLEANAVALGEAIT